MESVELWLVRAIKNNSVSTVTFVWLNQSLSHDFAGEEARALSGMWRYGVTYVRSYSLLIGAHGPQLYRLHQCKI